MGLVLGQALALCVALVLAALQIESIVVTGPLLAVAGYALAIVSWRLSSWRVFALAISAPAATACIAAVIASFRMGPGRAQPIVPLLLCCYAVLAVPVAIHVVKLMLRKPGEFRSFSWSPESRYQYSLKSLLILMTGACVVCFFLRWALQIVSGRDFTVFASYAIFNAACCGAMAFRFARLYPLK